MKTRVAHAGRWCVASALVPGELDERVTVIDGRGREWLGQFMERINRHYRTARYVRTAAPLRSIRDVVAFFEEMDELMLGMVRGWPGERLVIDARGRSVDEIKTILMDSIVCGDHSRKENQ